MKTILLSECYTRTTTRPSSSSYYYNFSIEHIYTYRIITGNFHNARHNSPLSFVMHESAIALEGITNEKGYYKGIMKIASYFTIYNLIKK